MNLQPSKSMNTSRFLGRVTIAFVYSMRCTGDGVSVGAQQQQNDHALSWKVNIATGTLKRYQENSFCWISMGPQIEIGSQMYTQQEAGNCCLMHFITLTYCVSNVKKCIYFKNVEGHKTKLKIKRLLPLEFPIIASCLLTLLNSAQTDISFPILSAWNLWRNRNKTHELPL